MTRAVGHEGVAADCLYTLFTAGRQMTKDEKGKALAACAVIAVACRALQRIPDYGQ